MPIALVGGDVEFALISLLNGVTYGLLLFMLSSGLTLIFSMMSVLNFAHASFFMLGAYFAYQIGSAASFWVALFLSPLLVGVLGALVERFGIRKAHRFGHVAELLFTFGLSFLAVEIGPDQVQRSQRLAPHANRDSPLVVHRSPLDDERRPPERVRGAGLGDHSHVRAVRSQSNRLAGHGIPQRVPHRHQQ